MGGSETIAGVTVRWAVRTDVGLNRKINEDSAVARPPVFMVADGMGGHDAGDVASQLVVDRFSSLSPNEPATGEMIVGLIRLANDDVFQAGMASSVAGSMGTTAVGIALVAQVDEPMWVVFNVGDSRAYRLEGGRLEQLSTDHSYVQDLVAAGSLTAEAARTHPQRNVVTRALGVDETVEADVWLRPPQLGERFLLCSDGLSGEVDDPHIAAMLLAEADPDEAADQLVAAALKAGGRDNVTVMVVDVVDIDSGDIYTTSPKEAFVERARSQHDEQLDSSTGALEAADQATRPATKRRRVKRSQIASQSEIASQSGGSVEPSADLGDPVEEPSLGMSSAGELLAAETVEQKESGSDLDPALESKDGEGGLLISGMPEALVSLSGHDAGGVPPGPKFDEPVRIPLNVEPVLLSSSEASLDGEEPVAERSETEAREEVDQNDELEI